MERKNILISSWLMDLLIKDPIIPFIYFVSSVKSSLSATQGYG